MAGWMTALKFIPWGDVIEAAPHIAKGARRLFSATRDDEPAIAPPAPMPASAPEGERLRDLEARVERLQATLAELAQEQRASAELIDSLAQHNARIVDAIGIMRARTRMLMWLSGGLTVALLALATWVALR